MTAPDHEFPPHFAQTRDGPVWVGPAPHPTEVEALKRQREILRAACLAAITLSQQGSVCSVLMDALARTT